MQYLLAITLLLTPTYAVRFSFFGLPANILMLWIPVVCVIFGYWLLASNRWRQFIASTQAIKPLALIGIIGFFLAGIISLFVDGFSEDKLGQFIVLFLEPITIFFIARYLWMEIPVSKTWFVRAGYLMLAVTGIYAIVQYSTLLGLPSDFWGNPSEPKRAITFFSHPNFYALFITPLLAFLFPSAINAFVVKDKGSKIKDYIYPLCWCFGALGLLLSMSRGGWLGLAAAIGVYLLVAGNKQLLKWASVIFIFIFIIILSVPNFRYRLLLPFYGEKSSVARISLWETGTKMIADSPIVGKGLLGFSNNWYTYNTDPNLDHYPAPHNIVLSFWVDIGLVGLLSFLVIFAHSIVRSLRSISNPVHIGVGLALIAMFVHGLIDIPYLKNDLALEFWLLVSLFL